MSHRSPGRGGGIAFLVTLSLTALVCIVPFLLGRSAGPPQQEAPYPEELAPLAEEWVAEFFPGDPADLAEHLLDPLTRHLATGADVYATYCSGCHGEGGQGNGASSAMLVPRPRNFTYGLTEDYPPMFKFRSTASGEAPLRADLERTIRNGLNGSSMPNHRLLDPQDVGAVAGYVLWIAQSHEFRTAVRLAYEDEEPDLSDEEERTDFYDEYVVSEAERIRERYASPTLLSVGQETTNDAASIERGREIYLRQGCHECHGTTGRGDGSSAPTLTDDWGYPVDPRDFSTGQFRAGSTGRDIYLRVRGGVAGTPMPAFDLANDDLWDMVHFIQSLKAGGA